MNDPNTVSILHWFSQAPAQGCQPSLILFLQIIDMKLRTGVNLLKHFGVNLLTFFVS
jgi:hypothetical protein